MITPARTERHEIVPREPSNARLLPRMGIEPEGRGAQRGRPSAEDRTRHELSDAKFVPGAGIEPTRPLRDPGFQAAKGSIDCGTNGPESPFSGLL